MCRFYASNFTVASFQLLRRIESSAQESLRTRDYLRALWKYNWAVSVCVHCKQSKSLPVLCTKCAHVALLLKGPDELDSLLYAYKHAYFSTKTKPGSEEVCRCVLFYNTCLEILEYPLAFFSFSLRHTTL